MNALTRSNLAQIDESLLDSMDNGRPLSDATKSAYLSDIRQFNAYLRENDLLITDVAIRNYFQYLKEEKHCKASTLNRKKYALLRIFQTMFKDNALDQAAIEYVMKHKTPTYKVENTVDREEILTPEQVRELRQLADDRLNLIIHFLWLTACRISELINIRIDRDVEGINGKVAITLIGKGKKTRTVKIPWNDYLQIRDVFQGETYLFETTTGNKYAPNNLWKQLDNLHTDLPRNPHIFRHSRATWMLQQGISLKAVSKFLGHSTTAITADLYIHDSVDYDELFKLDENAG